MDGEGQRREKPERLEIPREQRRLRPDLNRWGAKKEDGFQGGDKPLKRRCKAGMVLHEIARVDGIRKGNLLRSPWRRKALKGETQER